MSRIDAMSPTATAVPPSMLIVSIYNPAICHPVFFTNNVRKSPFPVQPDSATSGTSPVAQGYIWSSKAPSGAGETKL